MQSVVLARLHVRRAAKRLVGMGYRVELHEYEDVAHDFSAQMKADFTENVRTVLERELDMPASARAKSLSR